MIENTHEPFSYFFICCYLLIIFTSQYIVIDCFALYKKSQHFLVMKDTENQARLSFLYVNITVINPYNYY